MKNLRFNKAIQDIRKITMTSAEKQLILERIMGKTPISTSDDQIRSIKNNISSPRSPWNMYSFGISIRKHRIVSAVVIIVLIMFAGNSAVMASYDTIPGDTLYPIKVGIVEPIRIVMASTVVAKAEVRTKLVQERLREAEKLAFKGILTDPVEQKLNKRIEKQTTNLIEDVRSIEKIAPEKAEDIKMTVEASIEGHGHILEALAMDRGESSDRKTKKMIVVGGVGKVETLMDGREMNQEESSDKDDAKKAGKILSATLVKESSDNDNDTEKEKKEKEKNKSEYENKKIRLQSSIKNVSAKISTTTSTILSPAQVSVENEIQATLDKARAQLEDADTHIQKGETEKSRSALGDSERFLKEADFLLEAKSRLENEVKSKDSRESSRKDEKGEESKRVESKNKGKEKKSGEIKDSNGEKVEKVEDSENGD